MKAFTGFIAFISTLTVLAGQIEIGAYNVHNLFDSKHDKGKTDFEYMPAKSKKYQAYHKKRCENPKNSFDKRACKNPRPTDWTKSKIKMKLTQIKKVFDSRKKIPDILALTEIENKRITKKLAKTLGYKKVIVTDGPDKRGVDVGILYNKTKELKKARGKDSVIAHHVATGEDHPTRPILEVKFNLRTEKGIQALHVFVNHWPSQHAPNSEPRLIAARKLKEVMNQRKAENPDALLLATGDFNTTKNGKKDIPHPFRDELLVGSDIEDLLYVHADAVSSGDIEKTNMPKGTYYYGRGRVWNHLDRFFVSSNLLDGVGADVDLNTYEIYTPDFITRTYVSKTREGKIKHQEKNTPKSYNHRATTIEKAGFSDHFPIFIKLNY